MLAEVAKFPGDHLIAWILFDVAVIVIFARIMGRLALRVGQPSVVGEIVAGILLGPSILGPTVFAWGEPWKFLGCQVGRGLNEGDAASISSCFFPAAARPGLALIGQIGLAFFMFTVGLDFDASRIKGRIAGVVSVAFGVVAVPIGLAFVIAPILHDAKFASVTDGVLVGRAGFALMVAAMLSVTAFPVAVRILQEKGLTTTQLGTIGIASSALVTVLMFLLLGVAKATALDAEVTVHVKRLVGTGLLLVALLAIVRPLLRRWMQPMSNGAPVTGEHLAVIVGLLLFSSVAADRIGINIIVGSFLLGVVVPRHVALVTRLKERIGEPGTLLFLPVFLAVSGLNTDFTALGWAWMPGIAVLLLAGVVAKWPAGLVFGRLGGLSWREANVAGILMNCRGLLVLVVGLAALQSGVITKQMQVGAVVMALVTTAMTGPLIDRAVSKVNIDGR